MDRLIKKIEQFAYKNGKDIRSVFEDLLDYIIGYFSPTKYIVNWRYTNEQTKEFFDMLQLYFLVNKDNVDKKGWYDAWGDLYMSLGKKGNNMGQFFTPSSLCDLMAISQLENCNDNVGHKTRFGKRIVISDPSAGSSRNLLSAHAFLTYRGKRKPYLVAEDLDMMCCKMSAINMAIHGCFGEVICHNTLSDPKGLKGGFIINETMYPFPTPIPSIRYSMNKDDYYTLQQNIEQTKENGIKEEKEEKKEEKGQLSFSF